MFRGTQVDREDCIALAKHRVIRWTDLSNRYRETAKYEISEEKVLKNLEILRNDLSENKVFHDE
jgi:hypothetical protein